AIVPPPSVATLARARGCTRPCAARTAGGTSIEPDVSDVTPDDRAAAAPSRTTMSRASTMPPTIISVRRERSNANLGIFDVSLCEQEQCCPGSEHGEQHQHDDRLPIGRSRRRERNVRQQRRLAQPVEALEERTEQVDQERPGYDGVRHR